MTLIDPARFVIHRARIRNVGPRTVRKLSEHGFDTAADFIGGWRRRTKWPNGWTVEDFSTLVRPNGTECRIDGLGNERLEALLLWRAGVLRGELTFAGAAVKSAVGARIMCGTCGRTAFLRSIPGKVGCACGRELP